MMDKILLRKKTQIIKCKCGKTFAACTEPECYTDKDWIKSLRKYVLDGCSVEVVDTNSDWKFEKCICETENPNQLKLKLI